MPSVVERDLPLAVPLGTNFVILDYLAECRNEGLVGFGNHLPRDNFWVEQFPEPLDLPNQLLDSFFHHETHRRHTTSFADETNPPGPAIKSPLPDVNHEVSNG
jgi:hypothetical protein